MFHDPEVDVSQEEMRWKSVQAIKAGQPQQYVSEEWSRGWLDATLDVGGSAR